jgi:hypothetical protein
MLACFVEYHAVEDPPGPVPGGAVSSLIRWAVLGTPVAAGETGARSGVPEGKNHPAVTRQHVRADPRRAIHEPVRHAPHEVAQRIQHVVVAGLLVGLLGAGVVLLGFELPEQDVGARMDP